MGIVSCCAVLLCTQLWCSGDRGCHSSTERARRQRPACQQARLARRSSRRLDSAPVCLAAHDPTVCQGQPIGGSYGRSPGTALRTARQGIIDSACPGEVTEAVQLSLPNEAGDPQANEATAAKDPPRRFARKNKPGKKQRIRNRAARAVALLPVTHVLYVAQSTGAQAPPAQPSSSFSSEGSGPSSSRSSSSNSDSDHSRSR